MGVVYDCPGCDTVTKRVRAMKKHLKRSHPERIALLVDEMAAGCVGPEDPEEMAAEFIAEASRTRM